MGSLGTPAYMPPELWTGADASTRSDVYALGSDATKRASWEQALQTLVAAMLRGLEAARSGVITPSSGATRTP